MNNMLKTIFIVVLIGSMLVGCQQSPRKQYYLLSATADKNQTAEITRIVGLGPIEVAEYLQRSNVIVNHDANSLQIADNAYWGEPLQKGISRVLSINLMNHQTNRLVETFPWRSDSNPPVSIRLHIHDLQVIDSSAVLNVSWKLIDNVAHKTLTQRHYVLKKSCDGKAHGIAEVYSALMAELATEMHKALEVIP
jgi:uncharacterized protein